MMYFNFENSIEGSKPIHRYEYQTIALPGIAITKHFESIRRMGQ